MDERLDYYSSDEMLKKLSSQWMVSHAGSSANLERDSSRLFLQYKNYHLHLVKKKETRSDRVKIPASKLERMAYYRQYVNSNMKTQIVCMQNNNFNKVFWNYLCHIICKSLPHTYVHMFLASYTPETHIFVPKMVRLFYGFKFACIVTSYFEVMTCLDETVFIVSYIIQGLMHKSPWNKCINNFDFDNETINCYDIEKFSAKINNESWGLETKNFVTSDGEKFQLVQVEFYNRLTRIFGKSQRLACLVLMWPLVAMGYKFIVKKSFWKVFHAVQLGVVLIEVIGFTYLMYVYFDEQDAKDMSLPISELSTMLSRADVDMLAESMTAPPVMHVLEARSTEEIEPNRDSTAVILSNALLFIFRGIFYSRLRHHCQNVIVKAPIRRSQFNPFTWFYLWPIFLTTFFLGDLYFLALLILQFVLEYMSTIITFHCLVESIIHEWVWIKRWMVIIASTAFFTITYHFLKFYTHVTFWIYSKGIVTFAEIFAIYCFYPDGRLVDDITFHTGSSPTKLRSLSLTLMPFYYFLKLHTLMNLFISVYIAIGLVGTHNHYLWSWTVALVPYVLGLIYIIYKLIIKEKEKFQRLFIPVSSWGPQEQTIRMLRKLYDSRQYIGSQALRNLSRYMLEKSESKAFQLDINYDPKRRSTIPTYMYRMEPEKKQD